jgi:hypothetical protein
MDHADDVSADDIIIGQRDPRRRARRADESGALEQGVA